MRKALSLLALIVCVTATGCAQSHPGDGLTATPSVTSTLPSRVLAEIPTDHGPGGFVVTADGVYVGNHRGGTLQRIDPTTNHITSSLRIGGQVVVQPEAAADGVLWTCTNVDGNLEQINLAANAVTATVPARCDGGDRRVIAGLLWALPGLDTNKVLIFDAKTGQKKHEITVTGPAYALNAGDRVIVAMVGSSSHGSLQCRLDGTSCKPIDFSPDWLITTGGKLLRIPPSGQLEVIDPATLKVTRTYQVPTHEIDDIALVADDSGHLYYRPQATVLYRIDLATGDVTKLLDLPFAVANTGMAWGLGSLWVSNFTFDTVWRVRTT